MSIPPFQSGGVLPPFVGQEAGAWGGRSPYKTNVREIASSLCWNDERKKLFNGFLRLRRALRELGVADGVQWIDGSFCEQQELLKERPPQDIDVVTFYSVRPVFEAPEAWAEHVLSHQNQFDEIIAPKSKEKFLCDSYFVALDGDPSDVVVQAAYWFGLFSHQRASLIWKGMLEVDLSDAWDAAAYDIIKAP